MHSASLKPPPPPLFSRSSNFTNLNRSWTRLKPKRQNQRKTLSISLKCVQTSDSKSINGNPNFSPSCLAVTETLVSTLNVADKLRCLASEFKSLSEPIDRVKRLLHYAALLPPFAESARVQSNRVTGCTAQVWLEVRMDAEGAMEFGVDSDSEITKGFCSCLIWLLEGAAPEEVLEVKTEDLVEMNVGLPANSRVNTWHNVLISMQKRTKDLIAKRYGELPSEPFPSLVDINARGCYTEAQARYFSASKLKINELVNELKERNIDSAVIMAKDVCQSITVLGMDPMSEHVHVILDQAGFTEIVVHRIPNDRTDGSFTYTAANLAYMNFLEAAVTSTPSLNVIYIYTALKTKAHAHELAPTITCNCNAIKFIRQEFAHIPNMSVWYRPDSCMGPNIGQLFQQMAIMTSDVKAKIHGDPTGTPEDSCHIACTIPMIYYGTSGPSKN